MVAKTIVTTKERETAVLAVLNAAVIPLGPSEIGARIGASWSSYGGPTGGKSAAVVPVLRRLGAVRTAGGKYIKPAG